MHSRRPKEIKENIKKNKESAKAKEPKKDSMASLCRKPMTEAEMVASAQRQKQALAEWEKSNSPG